MANGQMKTCCILLSIILILGLFVFSIGEANARYQNTVSCNTVLEQSLGYKDKQGFFTDATEEEVIVLLGELDENTGEKEFSFLLETSFEKEENQLYWDVSGEHAEHFAVTMSIEGVNVEHENKILVSKDAAKTIKMSISVADEVWTDTREAIDADISVAWGERRALFRVIIAEVNPKETVDADSSEVETTEVPSEEVSDNMDEVQEEQAAEPVETTEQEDVENGITSIDTVDPEHFLPIEVIIRSDVTKVCFGLAEEEYTTARNFPAYTRYSLDNGKSFFVLYSDSVAEIDAKDITGSILFDFSYTDLAEKESISILMEPWTNGVKQEYHTISVLTDAADSFKTIENGNDNSLQISVDGNEATEENLSGHRGNCIVGEEGTIEHVFPLGWKDAEVIYSVQILETAENGSIVYNNVDNITAEHKKDESNNSIVISIGKNLPKAGTYKMYVRWEYKGICFYQNDINFFINYSDISSNTLKS